MEGILEIILSVLAMPFESKYDNLWKKTKRINNRALRILSRILLIAIPLAIIFCLCLLCQYLFRKN